jgi:hypothetical protein
VVPTYGGVGAGEQDLPVAVAAGDHVEMTVQGPAMTGRARTYAFQVEINDRLFTSVPMATLGRNDVLGYTAEAITELPSGVTLLGDVIPAPGLANFGTATFHYAFAYTRDAPYVVPLTQHKITLAHYGSDGVRVTLAVPSAPWPNPGDIPGNSFSVRFTGRW